MAIKLQDAADTQASVREQAAARERAVAATLATSAANAELQARRFSVAPPDQMMIKAMPNAMQA